MDYNQIFKKGGLVISWIFNQMEIFTSVEIMLPNRSVLLYAVYDSSQVLSTKESYSVLHATSQVSAYYLNKHNRLFMAF